MAASPFAVFPASSSTRQIWRFGLLCAVFALLWAIGSVYGLGVDSPFDTMLCHQLAAAAAWGLRLAGWVADTGAQQPNLLLLNNRPGVIVMPPCDGLVLYALLAGFVLAYPGPTQRRIWFIPLGILALWLLNVARIIALALNHQYSPETFEFDHHYAFNTIAYAALGGLWLLWTRQSSSAITKPILATTPTASPARQSWLTTRTVIGALLIVSLILVTLYQAQFTALLNASWAAMLTAGPAWLSRLPGATAGGVSEQVTRMPILVGVAYLGIFIGLALLALRLLLPDRGWRVVWRCYAGLVLASVLLVLVGQLGAGPTAFRTGRMLVDFLASLLPIAGLLVLLWRPLQTTSATDLAN